MSQFISRLAIATALMVPTTAFAEAAPAKAPLTAWEASRQHDDNATISTGVAKARDPLNSATSTSVIKEPDIRRLGTISTGELLRTLPGIRVEGDMSEYGNSYSIRGLPLVGDGAKYIQLQEDGLPILEFGDFSGLPVDSLLRTDLNLGSVESIRGGSASTFASDAPGGVINFIAKTGEVEGGSIMASTGLERGTKRIDADYGGHINSDWRFHIGGFYRVGEGPRSVGYDAYRGGQVKFNVTRQFAGGYVRLSLKVLDDHVLATSSTVPFAVSGTNADPRYASLPGFDAKNDSFYSRYITSMQTLNPKGTLETLNAQDGYHVKSLAIGLESQFDVGGWTVSDRFRYSRNSVHGTQEVGIAVLPGSILATVFGGPGATATYFSGPNAGQPFTPTANGNGLLAAMVNVHSNFHDLDFVVNDLRASRAFATGGGELTVTSGLYAAHQKFALERALSAPITDVAGNGNGGLVNLSNGGFPISQNGILMFNALGTAGNLWDFDVGHTIIAPYGSLNYHTGAFSLGGSVRYNIDSVRGTAASDNAGTTRFVDIDGNGTPSSFAETTFAYIPAGTPSQVHYTVRNLAWSIGVNWRVAENFSAFARYSSGGRSAADRILIPTAINFNTGALIDPKYGKDKVRQTELGFKFRRPGITFNVTGFYATTSESDNQLIATGTGSTYNLVHRNYRAYGAEFEGTLRSGPFSLNAGATLTHAEITEAVGQPGLVGKTARHQPALIWQLTPEYDSGLFSLGASLVGTTGSYAQDVNLLKMPGYVTVGLFARLRPVERVELGLNVSNLFDKLALVNVADGSIPATGVTYGNVLAGRRATASVRFFF